MYLQVPWSLVIARIGLWRPCLVLLSLYSLSCELLCLCVADADLIAQIAYLEEQRQLDDGLARKLYDNVFHYSESKISNSTNRKLKGRLEAAYGKTVQGKLAMVQK